MIPWWRTLWCAIREVFGDAAYDRYLAAPRRGESRRMTRAEFYVDSVERRYSSVSRCC
jgi:uncharacterized short protein YbdD (DUF466 family)